jgi:hypothetical protein
MILPVGKPMIKISKLDADGNKAPWKIIDIPVDGSTTLDTEEGEKTEYLEEGGGVVDSYQKQSKYTLTFTLYAKKGIQKPIVDHNGVIVDNYAITLTPEDPECWGFIMHKCSVSCRETYSSADGTRWEYKFSGLVSKETEEILDEWIAAQHFDLSANFLSFTAAEDTTGKTVSAALGAGSTITAAAGTSETWITATTSDLTVTVKVSENTTTAKRVGTVTVTDDEGKTATLKVIQAAGSSS